MKQTLIDLFTSKKFLAALTAVIVYVAGRFGFDVDTALLDRVYAALLVYVGAQGAADLGKSAALVRAATAASDAPPPSGPPIPGPAALLVLAFLGAVGALAIAPGCAEVQPRARAANGLEAGLDCTAGELATLTEDALETAKAWALKHVAGDDRTILTAQLKRDAQAFLGKAKDSCALVTALAILATPPKQQGLLAPSGPAPEDWGAVFAEVRAELGVRAVRVPANAEVR